RPWLAVLAAAGVLLVVALLLVASLGEDEGGTRGERNRDRGAANAPAEAEPEPAAEADPGAVEAPVEDMATYEDPEAGYQVSYPEGWDVEPLGDTRTDFRDPETGAYLRMDWTPTPGDDPLAPWEAQSDSFAARYDGYEVLRLEETTFQGYPAAVWEFTYVDGGAELHAVDIGVVTDTYGYALNFQTRAEDWEEMQPLFEAIQESFVPAS
ncbi:MAG: hypothetical protein M3134_12165, partial [Actinomycetota bacterium]|nr:hypothetical protein [Actinomycetota bacterium]